MILQGKVAVVTGGSRGVGKLDRPFTLELAVAKLKAFLRARSGLAHARPCERGYVVHHGPI